jgi:hypothetical protein
VDDGITKSNIGMSRRELLKRAAVVGGTLVWVSPLLQSVTEPALAGVTHGGDDDLRAISFIAFRFECDGDTFGAKVDFDEGEAVCGPLPAPPGQSCGLFQDGDASGCGRFELTIVETDEDGEPTRVEVTLDEGCTFLEGASKCGRTACEPAEIDDGTAVFTGCPKED